MENSKKNQFFTKGNKPSQSIDRRTFEIQAKPRNSRRRDHSLTLPLNNNNSCNNLQSPRQRCNYVDKRPRPRCVPYGNTLGNENSGNDGNNASDDGDVMANSAIIEESSCEHNDLFTCSSGLALENSLDLQTNITNSKTNKNLSKDFGNVGAIPKRSVNRKNVAKCSDQHYNNNTYRSQELEYEYEMNSVYTPGSKKQNLNHLLNFNYGPRKTDNGLSITGSINMFGRNYNHHYNNNNGGKKHKFNKEQFIQANFQFVVRGGMKAITTTSPDTLIDWDLIEQINIQATEEPQCPICLYPPIAGKITRCGHVYCWPCILHYLALTDKTWRKCPICYEAIHIQDLKSTLILQQKPFKVDDTIMLQLMCRTKGSMFVEKVETQQTNVSKDYPYMSSNDETKVFSKFLIASSTDVLNIIERERSELLMEEDKLSPQYIFIEQALQMLAERSEKILHEGDNPNGKYKLTEAENKLDKHPEQKNDVSFNRGINKIDKSKKQKKKMFKNQQKKNNSIENGENKFDLKLELILDANTIEEEPKEIENTNNEDLNKDILLRSVSCKDLNLINSSIPLIKYYYFYQCVDGQNIFLHPLNVKMLQACYGSLDKAPYNISAKILQQEHHTMDEDLRRKFTCLAHLPLTCEFVIVEIELKEPIVSPNVLKAFKTDLDNRRKQRQRRESDEIKRENHINAINERQLGKLVASTANLNLTSSHEFPIWGFEVPLMAAAHCGTLGYTDTGNSIGFEPNSGANRTIATTSVRSSYSAVTIDGKSILKTHEWPSISPTDMTKITANHDNKTIWGKKLGGPAAAELDNILSKNMKCNERNEHLVSPMSTNLGDVLAEAMIQKKHDGMKQNPKNHYNTKAMKIGVANVEGAATVANKKNKKGKKMQPLFSTGINYNGK